jgi:putative ATP-dependent endonuclease of the OLD family
MYLSKFIIINYKSCKIVDLDFRKDLPNILVGINDGGKTTILRSIGLLLGDKYSFNYKTNDSFRCDLSNTHITENIYQNVFDKYSLPIFNFEKDNVLILGKFEIEDNEIDEDTMTISNQLLWCLDNSAENFWICKVFSCKDHNERLYILIEDESTGSELWKLSDTNLNKKIKEYNVTKEDIENKNKVGRYKNIEKIRAIYSKIDLSKNWREYKDFKNDKEIFPKYRYLDWNMNLNELNTLIIDTMNTVVSKYKSQALDSINTLSINAESEINEIMRNSREILFDEIPEIEEIQAKFKFNITDEIKDILIKKSYADDFVHIESQGEGIKRRIWFAFIKLNALKDINQTDLFKKYIWCFDEPETHLYPASQREFYYLLKALTKKYIQTIISTHSTIFTDKSNFETIKTVNLESKYTVIHTCSSTDDIFDSLQLKNSDFLFFNKFLAVEGDTEEVLIPYLYKIYTKKELIEDGIQLIKLNSKSNRIQNYKILEQIIRDFRKPENNIFYILDSDSKYDEPILAKKANVKLIGRQDIEDSINSEVWQTILQTEYNFDNSITVKDIINLINSIPNDKKVKNGEKFYNKLQKLVRHKKAEQTGEQIDYEILPNKGKASGELLTRYINNINQIDTKIKEAFEQINLDTNDQQN